MARRATRPRSTAPRDCIDVTVEEEEATVDDQPAAADTRHTAGIRPRPGQQTRSRRRPNTTTAGNTKVRYVYVGQSVSKTATLLLKDLVTYI